MKRLSLETLVGFFLILGVVSFGFLAVKLGGIGGVDGNHYVVKARFTSTSGLKQGADVEMAGVAIGKVTSIKLDPQDYEAIVELTVPNQVKIQDDAIASVRSTGIIGGKYIKISPGGSDVLLKPGDLISETESSVNLEELIGKYMFEGGEGG